MFEWLSANWWAAWLAAAAALAIAEMFTLDLTLLMLATGALAAVGVALLFPGLFWAQVLAAVVVSFLMLGVLRPTLLRRLRSAPGYRSSLDKMVGSSGTVVREVTASGGEVKVAGEVWTARSYDGSAIAAGEEIEVFEVDGVTAVVYPRHRPLPPGA
mgnify:CR=1 FL=1